MIICNEYACDDLQKRRGQQEMRCCMGFCLQFKKSSGGTCSPHRPLCPSESFAGTSGPYDRPVSYSGGPPSGLPPSYGSLYH
ncbi:hypothetical protein M6B38_335605 [Iris pallida]|uniref:Uncharacterized protein n=1 Tax=Iris pallida TaxID=29817 RepID=A0AAX6H0S5_IRIPA|nr:hypothetical protein M6B38_232785 [Iris pallida]KAJ6834364.1 hypothetical protein M6B38_335605 [Iris pallida]